MTEKTAEYRTVAEQTAAEPTAIAEYRTTAAALALLRAKYAAPFDVTTGQGLAAAKVARAEVRGLRGALEKTRAEIKAPVLAQGQRIDAEAKRITAELLAIEEPIDAAIQAEERRKAEEKAARARAEAARVAGLQARNRRDPPAGDGRGAPGRHRDSGGAGTTPARPSRTRTSSPSAGPTP